MNHLQKQSSNISNINFSNTLINVFEMKDNYLNYVFTYNSEETYNCYKGHLEIILNYLISNFDIKYDIDLKQEYLFKFIQYQKQNNLSCATINKRINVIKRMFKYSNSSVNLNNVKSLKERYSTYDYLKNDELNILIDYVDKSKMALHNKLMIMLFFESGVRKKELKFIEVSNIDFNNELIFLTITKTNKPRYVCYGELTKKFLFEHLNKIGNSKYLFNLSNNAISSCFRRVQKILKFNNFSCYVLRHSYATLIVNNDGNMEMLRQTMGHEKLTTTQRYIHYNKDFIKKSYNKSFNLNKKKD